MCCRHWSWVRCIWSLLICYLRLTVCRNTIRRYCHSEYYTTSMIHRWSCRIYMPQWVCVCLWKSVMWLFGRDACKRFFPFATIVCGWLCTVALVVCELWHLYLKNLGPIDRSVIEVNIHFCGTYNTISLSGRETHISELTGSRVDVPHSDANFRPVK